MVKKENFNINEDLTGKLCNFRGHIVLVIKKYKLSFPISDDLKLQTRYDVMFKDGSIDIVSQSSLSIIE